MRMSMSYYFGFNTPEEQKKKRKSDLTAIGEKVTSFFWDIAPANGFEMREGQQDMSFEIVDALIHDQHFAVEAGVGIGKSFGYLVPVLLYNKRMKKPVIVATSTIALQEQLWDDIHIVMKLLNLQPEVILAKGQTHYLCHKRADEHINTADAVIPDELQIGLESGFQDRKQFSQTLPQNIWDKVNVQRFSMRNCSGCEKKCLYHAIRSKIKYTDGIILCNQDFLTAHLQQIRGWQDGLINREADLIVVDEAHNLDDKVRSATTKRINQGMLLGLIKSATNEVKAADRQNIYGDVEDAKKSISVFFDRLKAQMQEQIDHSRQDMRYADRFFFDGGENSIALLKAMIESIKSVALSIQIYTSFDYSSRTTAASDELDSLSESLAEMIEQIDSNLLWIERKGKNAELVYCPKNISQITNRLYFSGKERVKYNCFQRGQKNKGGRDCDGQALYLAERVDAIVLQAVSMIFEQIRDTPYSRMAENRIRQESNLQKSKRASIEKKIKTAQHALERFEGEILKCLDGTSNFTEDMIAKQIRRYQQELDDAKAEYAALQNARLNEAAEIRKLRTYYDEFRGWAEEFDAAPLEIKRMILSQLIERVEVGRKYQVTIKLNMEYQQFLEITEEQKLIPLISA